MSGSVEMYIEGQRAVIRQLRARGLPTYTASHMLKKLIAERNAAAAEARMRLYAAPRELPTRQLSPSATSAATLL